MAVYPFPHRWGGLSLSGHSPEHSDLSPKGKTSNSGMGYTLRSPWTRPLTGFFFQGQLGSNLLLQLWNRIIVRPVSSWAESTRLCHNTASAAVGCDGPVPGLSSRAVGATLNKPTSLGLANFQQAKPEKEPNLPLSPSLEAWLPVQAQTLKGKDTGMHEGTGGAPITGTSFRPITQENSREAIKTLAVVRNRCRLLGHAHRTMGGYRIPFVTLPPVRYQGQPLVPCHQGNMGVEADHRSILPQCLRALPELHYGDAPVNPRGPTTGPVVNFPRPERCLLSYRDQPSGRYLRLCHNGTAWQFTVLPFGLSTSPRVVTKILKPVLAFTHLHWVKLHMYLDDWLLNPGTHQEALEQTSWLKSLCRRLGLVLNLEKSDLIPSQVSTYLGIELDTLVGLARPSHKRWPIGYP